MNCQPEFYVTSIVLEGKSKPEKHETHHNSIHAMYVNNVISVVYHLLTQSSFEDQEKTPDNTHVLRTGKQCD